MFSISSMLFVLLQHFYRHACFQLKTALLLALQTMMFRCVMIYREYLKDEPVKLASRLSDEQLLIARIEIVPQSEKS